jgi:hypothetical protein
MYATTITDIKRLKQNYVSAERGVRSRSRRANIRTMRTVTKEIISQPIH